MKKCIIYIYTYIIVIVIIIYHHYYYYLLSLYNIILYIYVYIYSTCIYYIYACIYYYILYAHMYVSLSDKRTRPLIKDPLSTGQTNGSIWVHLISTQVSQVTSMQFEMRRPGQRGQTRVNFRTENGDFMDYPLVICYSLLLKMAHRNS